MSAARSRETSLTKRVAACRSNFAHRNLIIYRSCTPRYANETDLLTGQGSRLYGGRWNPIGIAAVYGGLSPETTLAECLAEVRYMGLDVHQAMPRVFIAIRIRLQRVLDLTNGAIRRRIGVSLKRMVDDDWRRYKSARHESLCQSIGRTAFEAGVEGLMVPSAADPKGVNMVIFPKNLHSTSTLDILRPEDIENSQLQ